MIDRANSLSFGYRLLVFAFLLLFASSLVNLTGGDWDGVQIVLGSVLHDEATKGYIPLYNVAWQPLSYGIIRLVYRTTHSVQVCMFLPALFGAAGLMWFLGALRKVSAGKLPLLLLAGVVLLIPELLFGSIYMNSTVFGFFFAAAALWLAVDDWTVPDRLGHRQPQHFLAGSLLALASLCRLDFALAYPMFVFLLVRAKPAHLFHRLLAFGLGSGIVFAIGYGFGVFDVTAALDTVMTHQQGTGAEGAFYYSQTERVLLGVIGVNLFVWIVTAVGMLYVLGRILRSHRWLDLLGVLPLAMLLYPMSSLTTPKYLVPLYMFVGLFAAWTLARSSITEKLPPSVLPVAITGAVLLACFLPIHPSRSGASIVHLTSETWRPTDDGPRAFWGYMFALREWSRSTPSTQWLDRAVTATDNLVLVAPFDGWIRETSASQTTLFHLLSKSTAFELGPDYAVARIHDKRVVLSEPGCLSTNRETYFSRTQRPPAQVPVPLSLDPQGLATLRCVARGIGSPMELARAMHTDPQTMAGILKCLVQGALLSRSGSDRYQLKHPLPQLASDPNQVVDP